MLSIPQYNTAFMFTTISIEYSDEIDDAFNFLGTECGSNV